MGPITASLVAALAVGAASGITETGKQIIPDAYKALKAALQRKFDVDSELVEAVTKAEAREVEGGAAHRPLLGGVSRQRRRPGR